jgi:hypothetical protein
MGMCVGVEAERESGQVHFVSAPCARANTHSVCERLCAGRDRRRWHVAYERDALPIVCDDRAYCVRALFGMCVRVSEGAKLECCTTAVIGRVTV